MKIKALYAAFMMAAPLLASCSDFFEQDSNHVVYTNGHSLHNATDTIYSVTGIQQKIQALADRTILLGEVRGDLTDINSVTSSDLRDVALFKVGNDNVYNQPRDYYAVINNCNYFLAKADTALRDGSYNKVFIKEYAAVKAYRAWTYLQLAINYGKVPFVTTPILTKEAANRDYPRKDLNEICDYFIKDIQPYVNEPYPGYGTIRSNDSRLFYFPIHLLLGDLNLWAGHYREAALCYYRYISTRNGSNSTYATGLSDVKWMANSTNWQGISVNNWNRLFSSESYYNNAELITMIPGDSIPSEGNYSQLRNLFNSTEENKYKVSLVPSKAMQELSEEQMYCHITSDGDTIYVPHTLPKHASGDLRYMLNVSEIDRTINGERITTQRISKYATRNVHIYRRTMVYLRMAEALNRAGFPRFAYRILSTGVNNSVIEKDILPYYPDDEAYLKQFDFPTSRYVLSMANQNTSMTNTMGLHDRGSGWSGANKYYRMPDDSTLTAANRLAYQIDGVEKMIADEEGLEFAFEGVRYYDLMRMALHRNEPAFLADRIYSRKGKQQKEAMKGMIAVDLYNPNNWYLDWNGKIGMK